MAKNSVKCININVIIHNQTSNWVAHHWRMNYKHFDPCHKTVCNKGNSIKWNRDWQIITPLLLRLNPFFDALFMLIKCTHSSGTYFTSFSFTSKVSPLICSTLHYRLPTLVGVILFPLPIVTKVYDMDSEEGKKLTSSPDMNELA